MTIRINGNTWILVIALAMFGMCYRHKKPEGDQLHFNATGMKAIVFQQGTFYPVMIQDSIGNEHYVEYKNDSVIIVGDTVMLVKTMAKSMSDLFNKQHIGVAVIDGDDTSKVYNGDTIVKCGKNPIVIPVDNIMLINDYVRNINGGGCGYFALRLYQRIEKKKYSIISIGGRKHVVLQEKKSGLYIDCNGYHDKTSLQLTYPGSGFQRIPEGVLRYWVYHSTWNKDFNRLDTVTINKYIDNL